MSDNFRQGMNVSFGNRTEKVDWRRLASTDVYKIKREMDYKTLQDNIMHITFCNIESEMGMYGGPLDPNFVKIFQLAQLIIEYLLHSQEFLSASLEENKQKAEKDQENAKENKILLEKKTETCHTQRKEIRRLKKWIAEYQLLMRAGASGLHKCPICDKSFVSQEYLVGHVNRRHQIQQQKNGDLQMAGFQGVVKVQQEQQSHPPTVTGLEKSALMGELTHIKERLQATEQELMNERNARETLILREKDQQSKQDAKVHEIEEKYQKWKIFEEKKHQRQMDVLKNSLMQELHELQAQKDSVTQVLSELQEQARMRPSMLGTLKDEDEPDFTRRPDKIEIAGMMKEQFEVELNKLMTQNKQEMQKELQKLNQKWKKKEENLQKEHEVEMEKLQMLLGQYEKSVNAERTEKEVLTKEYELLRKKVQDHDKVLDSQRNMKEKLEQSIQKQQQQLNALSPPSVSKRETTFAIDEPLVRERAKTPNQAGEMLVLHVSCNDSHNQYRIWRERSNTPKEWSDMFSFSAASQPSEQFTSPVYVYSSGGSPYWRQFISASPKPPSSEYRMDYMFFVSPSPGPSMMQLHVLDSGSVPVVKSCVSKSSILPGWKEKGLSFYVIKSSLTSKTAVSMSTSWDSTLESAAVNDKAEKSFDASESEAESGEEEILDESKNVDESNGSTSLEDSRGMTSGLSSLEWGSTLPEVGEFRPYPKNPFITTRFNHNPQDIEVCRQEIVEVIERKLERQGLTAGTKQMSSQKMEARMSALNQERQARAKKVKGYSDNRQRCAQRVEDITRKTYNRDSSTRPADGEVASRPLPTIQQSHTPTHSRPPTLKAAGHVARFISAPQQPNRNQLRTSQTLSSTGCDMIVRTSQTLSSTGSSGGDATLSGTSVTERSSFTATSVTDRTLSESEEEEEEDEEEDVEDLNDVGGSEESNWDNSISDDGIKGTSTVPRVAVHIPTQTQQEIRTRKPRGEKVRQLTASLERNLSLGRDVKKPAGSVSLFADQGPSQQRAAMANDDMDDDSDFSLTSLEEGKKPSPTPRTLRGSKMSRTYNPPARSQSQPVARPRTLTPATSAVTAFTFDDEDFDDDDLDIHHLT